MMKTLTLELDCDTEPFREGKLKDEVARILRHASQNIEYGMDKGTLQDYHGNVVGTFKIEEKD